MGVIYLGLSCGARPIGSINPENWIFYTPLYDTGFVFIVLSQLSLRRIMQVRFTSSFRVIKRLFVMSVVVVFGCGEILDVFSWPRDTPYNEKVASIFAIVGPLLSTCSMAMLAATMLLVMSTAVNIAYRWIRYKSVLHMQWMVALGSCLTCLLVFIRLGPDIMRKAIHHQPSLAEHVVVGVAPELLIASFWLFLIRAITKWELAVFKMETRVETHLRRTWLGQKDCIAEQRKLKAGARQYGISLEPWSRDRPDFIEKFNLPGVLQLANGYMKASPEVRSRFRLCRPAILCEAERLVPGLLATGRDRFPEMSEKEQQNLEHDYDLFSECNCYRYSLFRKEAVTAAHGIDRPGSAPEEPCKETHDEIYDPTRAAAFSRLLEHLFESAIKSITIKNCAETRIFDKVLWELDLDAIRPKFTSTLVSFGYSIPAAQALTTTWLIPVFGERGMRADEKSFVKA